MSNYDKMLITEQDYPALFKAFETIAHDNGAGAGHTNYMINLSWKGVIHEIEHDLKMLLENADLDFETLCIGEETERQDIVRNRRIHLADTLLQEFFEEL